MFNQLILTLEKYDYKFITKNFMATIKKNINNVFTNMNYTDINVLSLLTSYIIEDIMSRYTITEEFFTQYNARDIISLCLTLIPFIKDSNYTKIKYLRELLYKEDTKNIPSSILKEASNKILEKYFPYSNMALGLLNNKDSILLHLDKENSSLLNEKSSSPVDNYSHLIYTTIHHNFVAMLETIKITNGKLFVNWINTIPTIQYKKTIFYKRSRDEIKKILKDTSDINIKNVLKENKGLWLGDYYNILTNGYYRSIKSIKWMIFCRKIITKDYYYSIQYINHIFDIDKMFLYENYESMVENDKLDFNNKLIILQKNIKNNIPTYLDINFEIDLFKNLFIFMINQFSKKNLLPYFYIQHFLADIENSMEDLDNDEIDQEYIEQEILSKALEIDPALLWNYIKESLVILKSTIYGSYLIKKDKIDMNYFFFKVKAKEITTHRINLKNIYNIAKLLCHDLNEPDFEEYSGNFKGLTMEQTCDFFKKYSNIKIRNHINRNIKFQEGNNDYDYKEIINTITNGWNKIKQYIIWNYLNYNGLLSDFIIPSSNNLTPKQQIDRMRAFFKENPTIFDMNYFMTNEPYNNMVIHSNKIHSNKIHGSTISYADFLVKELKHYTFYANDWISQLNFYNHYINHSIIYVTGSTGTGKSTQIPKLALYCLKMYDYRLNGKVICTEPRIPPTQENAKRIASEMGLEISYTKNKIEKMTTSYYIQYQHMKSKHIKENCPHLVLRLVTDGTLLEDLVKNPLLKETFKDIKDKNTDVFSYSTKNKYDIVIVDEAHEHNANMDIILTLMRQTCIYNNMTRLIIISATMDDDEPIYRYYYKLVNDNIVFPIKKPLHFHPILNTDNFMINSIYLDRRINISAPGKSTLEKVNEYYEGTEETLDMKRNYNNMIESSYTIINNICSKYMTGDILLFSIGKEEIIQAVNRLNEILPRDTIALPYYSEMASIYRNIVLKIDENIGKIRNKRNMIGTQWGSTFIPTTDVSEGTYKRAIIIATNVAEASITIPSLKFVVDTGYSKVNRYNIMTDSSSINIEMISESSRIQRRGRVGRSSEGSVFYTYKKNARLNVPPKYGITLIDFHTVLLKLAINSSDDINSNPLWEDILSPYLPSQYEDTYFRINSFLKNNMVRNIKNYNIDSIIIKQFPAPSMMPISEYFYYFNEYYPVATNNRTLSLPPYLNRYASGYNSYELFDLKGSLYIIHPFEEKIKRNVMGGIISYNKITTNIIDDKMYQPMISNMRVKMLYLSINTKSIKIKDNIYKKTVYAEKILEVMRIMSWEEKESIILLLGSAYNIVMETCMVQSMIQAISKIQPLITNMIKKNDKYIMIDSMKSIFESDSDISSLYNVCNKLQIALDKMEIFKIITLYNKGGNAGTNLSSYREHYIKLTKNYYRNEIKDIRVLNVFNSLHYNGLMDSEKGFLHWLTESNFLKNKIEQDILVNCNIIKNLCDQLYLDYKTIMNFLTIFTNNILLIISANKEVDISFNEMGVFDWAKQLNHNMIKNLKNNMICTKLNMCFFFGQPLIAVKKDSQYISMRDGNMLEVNTIFNKANTLCNKLGSYMYFYSQSNGKMTLMAIIDPIILPLYYPIHYNTNYIKMIYSVYSNDNNNNNNIVTIKEFNNNEWERLVYIVKNNSSYVNFPFFTPILPVIEAYIKTL